MGKQLLEAIKNAKALYYRLVLLVAPVGDSSASPLQEFSSSTSAALLNVNPEPSCRMLDLTERERALKLLRLLGKIVGETTGDLVLLGNTEVLITPEHPEYRCYPIRYLLVLGSEATT